MATSDNATQANLVSCEVCLKEVPIAEATVSEAADYFAYFCGLECYEKWKSEAGVAQEPAKQPGE